MYTQNRRFASLLGIFYLTFSLFMGISLSFAHGNQWNESFTKAKRILETEVYQQPAERVTLYCQGAFDEKKQITPKEGFSTKKYVKRAQSLEWEHVVPAENFGRTFEAWRDGDAMCVNSKGKAYKGRKCAEKVSSEYCLMQADMHNLYPSIGAVNASRSNYNFMLLPDTEPSFGMCQMKVENRKVEPPVEARGKIARAYLYMDNEYPRYHMSSSQKKLMQAWNKMYPVTEDECSRAFRIASLQGNQNPFVEQQCVEMGLVH